MNNWQINDSHQPCVRDDLASVVLDAEGVVYDPATGHAHVLNHTAMTVLPLLDGTVSLQELAVDIAAVFDLDAAAVVDDLVALAQALGRLGLLVGVEADGTSAGADPCA